MKTEPLEKACAGNPCSVKKKANARFTELRLENDPRFLSRVAAARRRIKAGEGVRLEDLQ
jgi:hypothetical protein